MPILAITLGDLGGVGPEVAQRAMDEFAQLAVFRVFGRIHGDFPPRPTPEAGRVSFSAVVNAIKASQLPPDHPDHVDAIVTAPISKEAWAMAGCAYPGHTELLAERFGVRRHAMMFVSPQLNVVLATAHVPLADVPKVLTTRHVTNAIDLGADACRRLGVPAPRVAICGLNPHAGENGLLGSEDQAVIAPAIEAARARGIDASGPHPADTVFRKALDGRYDLVVAMYHDQGLIPVKTLAWETAVNVTLGLPVIRTSPDHGTAYDIAGKGIADHRSMKAAIELAVRMVSARRL